MDYAAIAQKVRHQSTLPVGRRCIELAYLMQQAIGGEIIAGHFACRYAKPDGATLVLSPMATLTDGSGGWDGHAWLEHEGNIVDATCGDWPHMAATLDHKLQTRTVPKDWPFPVDVVVIPIEDNLRAGSIRRVACTA